MSYNVADLKTRLNSKVHNSINKVQDINNLIYEAGCNLLLYIDPAETIRTTALANALYDDVYSYSAPTDLKDDRIISLIPEVNAGPMTNYNQTYPKNFNLYKDLGDVSINNDSGIKTLGISGINTIQGIVFSDANSLTDNGTWSAGGNATNLTVDTFNYVSGSASLRFDISASGSSAYIENSTLTSVDLTNYLNVGSLFVYVYIPSTTVITSITTRWGTDSSNYYSATATATHDNTAFVTGWNLVRFDWSSATTTGSPTITDIQYARVQFNYNGTAITSCRVDNVVFRLGTNYNLTYYSKFLFKDTSGTWLERPTALDDSDTLNLDTTGYNMLLAELAYLAAQEIGGEDSGFDVNFFEKERARVWGKYAGSNKSQALKRREFYYRPYVRRRR